MSWERITFTDKLTRQVIAYEVLPYKDSATHVSSQKCLCLPDLQEEAGILMLVHNAFDGREFAEPNHKELGH